ncbi:MAG: hypothetical protein V3574_03290 [Candidatus Moraniibacteriota bacterium]
MRETRDNNRYKFFIYLSLFWIIIAWGAYLLSLAGIFYWWSVSLLIALVAAGSIRFVFSALIKTSPGFILFNLLFIACSVTFVYFSAPTIFSGRDQASISQAAIRLAQNGQLAFSTPVSNDFFAINNIQKEKIKNCLIDKLNDFQEENFLKKNFYQAYCQALTSTKAFNFPGFYYTDEGRLVTQFPLAYIAWLAIFYSFLGLPGFAVANGILLYVFFLAFFLLIEKLTAKKERNIKERISLQIFSFIIPASSFCFMWFSKFTLTENMAVSLLWTGLLATILFFESTQSEKIKKPEFILFFLSLGLLIFTRIEGLAFFIMGVALLFINKKSRRIIKKHFLPLTVLFLAVIFVIFLWNLVVDIYLYKSILKASLENIQENAKDLNKSNSLLSIFDLFKVLGLYGILTPIFFGLGGIFYFLKQKKYLQLIPLFIVLPALIYLISPQITPEHPWMLRRFSFAILPLFLFYSLLPLGHLSGKKKLVWGLVVFPVILFFNFKPFVNYLTFIPTKNLLADTQALSQKFSPTDLILVDQLATGDKYEMMADPLNSVFGKSAVYFFNYQDLEKIDTTQYSRIYLLAPTDKKDYYQKIFSKESLVLIDKYEIKSDRLISEKSLSTLPRRETQTVQGLIFQILP